MTLATIGYFAAANMRPDHGEQDPILWLLAMTVMLPGGMVGRFLFDHLIPQAPFETVLFSSVVATNSAIVYVIGRLLDSRRKRQRPDL